MTNKRLQDVLVTIISGLGMLLSTLDTGIINVALAYLTKHFHTTTGLATFTITGYTLALALFILPFGLFSDRFGKLRLAGLGFLLFGLSSLLCGLASQIGWLIGWRIVQGIGAAALQATSAALITTLVTKENQNNALSVLGVMIGAGPVLGPSLGGLLLSLGRWQFIFWINLPFALAGILSVYYLLLNIREKTTPRHFDFLGAVLSALTLIFLLLGLASLSELQKLPRSLGLLVASLGTAVGFYKAEHQKEYALIDVHNLKESPQLRAELFQTFAFGLASAVIFLLPPFIFEKLYHLDVGLTGLLVLGAPLGLVIFSRVSGKLNRGSKNHVFSRLGLGIMALALTFLLSLSPTWPYLLYSLGLFLYGVGGGYFQPANLASIMGESPPERQGSTGALQRMVQNVALASGSALGATCLSLWPKNILVATRSGWLLALVVVGLSLWQKKHQ